jgi:branched-chain amino acid transport system substrate-binding protein
MTDIKRRKLVQAIGSATALGPFAIGSSHGQAHKGEIVIGASQPITGVFSFAGTAMNNGLNDFVQWKNANGGVQGRMLRYVSEDS